jgi:hypothetical protein
MSVLLLLAGFDTIYFPPDISGGRFIIQCYWVSVIAGINTTPSVTFNNVTVVNKYFQDDILHNASGFGENLNTWVTCVDIDGISATGSSLEFSFGADPIDGQVSDVSIVVTSVNQSDTFV